jgi:hypothetical protein
VGGGGVGGVALKSGGTDANVPTFTLVAVDPTVPKKPYAVTINIVLGKIGGNVSETVKFSVYFAKPLFHEKYVM